MNTPNRNIFDSPAWLESHATRIVWVTMLMLMDGDGLVELSMTDLACASNVSFDEVERALVALQRRPDVVVVLDRGWRVVDHQRYAEAG